MPISAPQDTPLVIRRRTGKGRASLVDWAELARQLLELVKSVAWQLVACFALFLFRKPMAEKLRSMLSLKGPAGSGAEFAPQPQEIKGPEPSIEPSAEVNVATSTAAAAVDVPNNNPTEPTTSVTMEQVVAELGRIRRILAEISRRFWAERLHRHIYGSQIRLVTYLEAVGQRGASEEEVRNYYAEHVKEAEAQGRPPSPFAEWIGYIVSSTAAEVREGRYCLTPNGGRYIQYARAEGLPSKAF